MSGKESVSAFLASTTFAVAGASNNRDKYGNKVFLALQKSGRTVFPLNPIADSIEGSIAYKNLHSTPQRVEALSIVTPPMVTRQVVTEAIEVGVKHIWMQPGAQDEIASRLARQAGINVIDDGSCILVGLATEG